MKFGLVSYNDPCKMSWYIFCLKIKLSNEKNPAWLGKIGDYTTQLYRDYDKPL